MTATIGLNIVIAVVLGLMALVCAIASLSLKRNAPLAWLAGGLGVGAVQTLIVSFAQGTWLEFVSAMVMAPFGFWLANMAIRALMPQERRWPPFMPVFAGLCVTAAILFAAGAPFFFQVLVVQLACTLAMIDATLRIASGMRWRVLDAALLVSVVALALFRLARLPLLIWYFGPAIGFFDFNGSDVELALLAGESLLTMGIISLVIAAIIGDTIAKFRHQSERDGLTGLLNRRAFDDLAAAPIAGGGAAIFCDIDEFKRINDRFGHQTGDDVIVSLANIIKKTGYAAGRIGGEEFAILVPDGSMRDGLDLAEMFRARFHGTTHANLSDGIRTSASFGVAIFAPGTAPQSCFADADRALYKAKRDGRNRVVAEQQPTLLTSLPEGRVA